MNKIIEIAKNIQEGPVTTVLGVVLFLFGGWMVYTTYKSEDDLVYVSVEVGVFLLGVLMLLAYDDYIASIFTKKKKAKEDEGVDKQ